MRERKQWGICLMMSLVLGACDDKVRTTTGDDGGGLRTWHVGSVGRTWTDPRRDDTASPAAGDKRTVMTRIYFPADGPGQTTVSRRGAPFPLIVFSPGYCVNSEDYAPLLTNLAENGFVVTAVDHPYVSASVTYPGGEQVRCNNALSDEQALRLVSDDLAFALEQTLALDAGADGAFGDVIDETRLGVFGHSMGASGSADVFFAQPRFDALVMLDGDVWFDVPGGRRPIPSDPRPLLLHNAGTHTLATDPTQQAFWDSATGSRFAVEARSQSHGSYIFRSGAANEFARLVQAYNLAFFQMALRGAPVADVLSLQERFPSATVRYDAAE